jgi:hypothetical protein
MQLIALPDMAAVDRIKSVAGATVKLPLPDVPVGASAALLDRLETHD